MSKYSPHDCFRKTPDLRTREVPEWGSLLIYTPAHPDIHYLDARSWLIFELCEGTTFAELISEFGESVAEGTPAADVESAVTTTLVALEEKGLITRTAVAEPTTA